MHVNKALGSSILHFVKSGGRGRLGRQSADVMHYAKTQLLL